jgi:hypothetical protein
MKRAINAFKIYSDDAKDQDYFNVTQANTYLFWLQYFVKNDCSLSKENLSQAVHFTSLFVVPDPALQTQIADLTKRISTCQ